MKASITSSLAGMIVERYSALTTTTSGSIADLQPGQYVRLLDGSELEHRGRVTGLTLGNGVAETLGYDANRLQLTSQVATKSGGPTGGLMNLTYDYQASAGQMGSGSTAGNAGQLMAINNSSTINAAAESAAYSYDNLGRLVTSNQTSNGVSTARGFAYDRWGNRTGMWDAVSGGNQLQNIVIDGANHIWNVNSSTSDPNYYYDPGGNLVWAQGHSYTYDAENRLASVDNGSTAQYKYDHQNRRVSKIIGSSWTHYVWQGSQVIGEHDATTAYTTNPTYQVNSARTDYIYSGSRMISSRERASSGGAWITKYYLSDRLSARLELDTSGNVLGRMAHLPFGEDFGESGTQGKHHFTSYERDSESGTDYAINRGYSPAVGRFMSADPYKPSGYMVDPQSWNRYSYSRNDPVNLVDRLGLLSEGCPNCVSYEVGCAEFPELCYPHVRPPFGDGGDPTPHQPPSCIILLNFRLVEDSTGRALGLHHGF